MWKRILNIFRRSKNDEYELYIDFGNDEDDEIEENLYEIDQMFDK
jgi:hypothetical protein